MSRRQQVPSDNDVNRWPAAVINPFWGRERGSVARPAGMRPRTAATTPSGAGEHGWQCHNISRSRFAGTRPAPVPCEVPRTAPKVRGTTLFVAPLAESLPATRAAGSVHPPRGEVLRRADRPRAFSRVGPGRSAQPGPSSAAKGGGVTRSATAPPCPPSRRWASLADRDGFDTPGPSRCGPAANRGASHPQRDRPACCHTKRAGRAGDDDRRVPVNKPTTLAAALALTLSLGACSGWNDDRGVGDAPADQQGDQPVKVWPMPDQFANIAAFCIGTDGVYVTTREAAPAVVADDPNCGENGILTRSGG